MGEVSTVTSLIFRILGFIIAVGSAATFYDSVEYQKNSAATAIRKDQISYRQWNRQLHRK